MLSTIRRFYATLIVIGLLMVGGYLIVAISTGSPHPSAPRTFTERIGYWFGPVSGLVLCLVGGWFVARALTSRHVLCGAALGAAVAALDTVVVLLLWGESFEMIYLLSNLGRVVAGGLGGWIASRAGGEDT
jgi:hypothetical protein